jgi:hypothetical protein
MTTISDREDDPTTTHSTSAPRYSRSVAPVMGQQRSSLDLPLEGEDLPPMIKRKKRGNNVVVQCLQGKRSTVLALSRTLCAGSADVAGFAAASLTAASRNGRFRRVSPAARPKVRA